MESHEPPPAEAEVAVARIHDLGYRRYLGTRRPQSSRYRVILRNMLRSAWKGWWRTKLWIFGTGAVVVVLGILMLQLQGKLAPSAELVGDKALTFPDFLLAQTFSGLVWIAFLMSMTVISGTVARDLRAGAFEFYFSRPVRPRDYILGKLGGACILVGVPMFVAPALLAMFRVGLAAENLGVVWPVIPQTLLIGAISTVVFAALPLAFSCVTRRPAYAIVAWAAFFLVLGPIVSAIGLTAGIPELLALNINGALTGVTFGFYGWDVLASAPVPPLWASLASLSIYGVLAVAVIFWRVRALERAGIGGP